MNRDLVEAEVDLDGDHDGDWGVAVFQGGLELVFTDGFESLFIESHAEGSNYAGVLGIALGIDDEGDEADTLVLGTPRLV